MNKVTSSIEEFSLCMSKKAKKIADRALAFFYYYAIKNDSGTTLKQIISDFEKCGLGSPNITKLRTAITKDRRLIKVSKDSWRLKSDKISEIEIKFQLNQCLKINKTSSLILNGEFINIARLEQIKNIKGSLDFSRLTQMLSELNHAFLVGNYISVSLLTRAIIDHIPPIFGLKTFSQVASNHGTKSFKDSMDHLDKSCRKIADLHLHTPIRKNESLPNKTQVDFSSNLDVLLGEIVRVSIPP